MPLFHREHERLDADTMVALTESGKRAIDKLMIEGRAYPVLVSLDEHSPRSLSNLSRECRMDIHLTKQQVSRLKRQGLVQILDL